MKKLFLFALLASFVGIAQAQQTSVRAPELFPHPTLDNMKMEGPSIFREIMVQERLEARRATKNATGLKKTNTDGTLFDIGKSANTYGMVGDSRNQIAFDPKTNSLGVIFRGSDRDPANNTAGNTLYIRYSSDNGATWGPQGDNISNTASPRYPNIFLSQDQSNAAAVSAFWAQTTQYTDGNSGFGLVPSVRSGMGNSNQTYGSFPTPPLWMIPFEAFLDQPTGDLYSASLALDPASGDDFGEIFLFKSTDKGVTWTTDLSNPVYTSDIVPTGYFASNLRFDMSPDGSTMIMAFALIIESEPGFALIVSPDHEIAWRISTDKGATWGPLQRVKPSEIANKPAPFDSRCNQTWDFDVVLDKNSNPHFLTVLTADENPFWIQRPNDSTITWWSTDSSFVSEVVKVDGDWKVYPIGPARSLRTSRLSFTALSSTSAALVIRNEPKWARNWDGDKIYAKWISPWRTWISIGLLNGQTTIFPDTTSQVYVNGRPVDNSGRYLHPWAFGTPDPIEAWYEKDSLMRYTSTFSPMVDEFDAFAMKFTKVAKYASDEGDVHIIAQEWGVGENRDDDAVNSDQTVWYVQGVKLDVTKVGVEQVNAVPGDLNLQQNYPNPFNPSTEISFTLPTAAQTALRVYNVLGQNVATLANEYLIAGTHKVSFDAGSLPTGMYIYRLESGSASISKKMMLSK